MPYSKKPYKPIIDLEGEIWKDIEGYEGYYAISNLGRAKSLDRTFISKAGILYNFKSKLCNIYYSDRGYAMIKISKECKEAYLRLHILVAKLFIPNPENKPEVNHKKGINRDNRASELEWNTHQENIEHRYKVLGLKLPSGQNNKYSAKFKMKHPTGKIEEVTGINEVAKNFNLHASAIHRVLNNKQKQHKGYYFFYDKKIA